MDNTPQPPPPPPSGTLRPVKGQAGALPRPWTLGAGLSLGCGTARRCRTALAVMTWPVRHHVPSTRPRHVSTRQSGYGPVAGEGCLRGIRGPTSERWCGVTCPRESRRPHVRKEGGGCTGPWTGTLRDGGGVAGEGHAKGTRKCGGTAKGTGDQVRPRGRQYRGFPKAEGWGGGGGLHAGPQAGPARCHGMPGMGGPCRTHCTQQFRWIVPIAQDIGLPALAEGRSWWIRSLEMLEMFYLRALALGIVSPHPHLAAVLQTD